MQHPFLPCIPKALPDDQLVAAAQTAIALNPDNEPLQFVAADLGPPPTPERLAFETRKYWGRGGIRLTVGFMETTPTDLAKRILLHANAWGAFCNVQFVLSGTDPDVRITRSEEGYWSYLGTDIKHIPRNRPTMCLQAFTMQTPESEFVRVVRHEFGHTLGCPHEHMRRQIVQRIDPQKATAYFWRTQGWTAQMVQSQVLTPLEEAALLGTPRADEISIMAYQLPASITRDGQPIVGGKDFSTSDREFAASVYPLPEAPEKPPEPPTKPTDNGGFMGNLGAILKLLTQLGPLITWLMSNQATLTTVIEMLKKIAETFSKQPAGAYRAQLGLTRDQLREALSHAAGLLKSVSAITPTPVDDLIADVFVQAVNTDWLLDLLTSILSGQTKLTQEMVAQAAAEVQQQTV